jgi:hypothetical protein
MDSVADNIGQDDSRILDRKTIILERRMVTMLSWDVRVLNRKTL